MPTKITHSTFVFSLSVLLGMLPAFAATPAQGADQATVNQRKASASKPIPPAKDTVRAHLEILEWQLSAKELAASTPMENQDWIALATRDDARTRVMHIFDSVIEVGDETSFTSGVQVPFLRYPTRPKKEHDNATINYQDVGSTIGLLCNWVDDEQKNELEVTLDVQLSDLITNTPINLAGDVSAPVFAKVRQKYRTKVGLGQRQTFLRLTNQHVGQEEKILAYLFSIRFDKPAPR